MKRWSRCRTVELLLTFPLVASTPGCSYAFVRGPRAPPEGQPAAEQRIAAVAEDCTTSNAAPILDTVLGTVLVLTGMLFVVGGVEEGSCTGECWFKSSAGALIGVGIGVLALGGLSIASASTGYDRTADCRRLYETLPGSPQPRARYLLDVGALAETRQR